MTHNDEQLKKLENKLWKAATQLRSHGELKPSEYTFPVLGLIFLKYADKKFHETKTRLEKNQKPNRFGKSEPLTPLDFQKEGVLYLTENATYDHILRQPESTNFGKLINDAMRSIEENNDDLKGVLPKSYQEISNENLIKLLREFSTLDEIEGDNFGLIYEFFMGNFELEGGQKGGEFFTPRSLVNLIVSILEPYRGTIYDPACGSGGMFVQSLNFIKSHKKSDTINSIAVYGQEIKSQTIKLARMNLSINGLEGHLFEGNSMYKNPYESVGKFDYVMANPPFNLSGIDRDVAKSDPRFLYGIPSTDNANYLWIQIFATSLNENGRAGFVMSSQAGDAGASEKKIRQQLIEESVVDVMISVGSNFFYTVALPCTLWFFDKGKKGTPREKQILFIDAKDIFRQIDRAHREFTSEQIEFLSDIVKLYRDEKFKITNAMTKEHFVDGKYEDILGLCSVANLEKVATNDYSLNPGRYVGVKATEALSHKDFAKKMHELHGEWQVLTKEAHGLEGKIDEDMKGILEE